MTAKKAHRGKATKEPAEAAKARAEAEEARRLADEEARRLADEEAARKLAEEKAAKQADDALKEALRARLLGLGGEVAQASRALRSPQDRAAFLDGLIEGLREEFARESREDATEQHRGAFRAAIEAWLGGARRTNLPRDSAYEIPLPALDEAARGEVARLLRATHVASFEVGRETVAGEHGKLTSACRFSIGDWSAEARWRFEYLSHDGEGGEDDWTISLDGVDLDGDRDWEKIGALAGRVPTALPPLLLFTYVFLLAFNLASEVPGPVLASRPSLWNFNLDESKLRS